MGKKKATGQTQHATKSFQQLVAEAAFNVSKVYVDGQIKEQFRTLSNSLVSNIFRQQTNYQTRLMAVENILSAKFGISETDIKNAVADVEDEATGYQTAKRPAVAGDLVRLRVQTKSTKNPNWTEDQYFQVTNLLNLGQPEGAPLSLGSVTAESAVVGLEAGETKEVLLDEAAGYYVRLNVDRVSEKIPTVVATTQTDTGTPNENKDA